MPDCLERAQNPPDAIVHERHEPVVCGGGLAHFPVVKILVIVEKFRHAIQFGVTCPGIVFVSDREVDANRVVKCGEWGWRDERIVRAYQ